MAEPFEKLPQIMTEYANGVLGAVGVLVRVVSRKVGEVVVESTRVDTGKARSNWIASIDHPSSEVIEPYSPGSKLGIGETANASAAIAQQANVIKGFNVRRNHSVYISNDVSYIGALNNGSPTTSADQMTRKAVQAAKGLVSKVRIVRRRKTVE